MVFFKTFAQVVYEQSQMEQPLLFDLPIDATEWPWVVAKIGGTFDGLQRVFVDGEFVILIELHQISGMFQRRDKNFQHANIV